MAQWRTVRLPMQKTWVWSLIWEGPTGHRATKPAGHSDWEPGNHNYWSHASWILCPTREAQPWLESSPHWWELKESLHSNKDPAQPITPTATIKTFSNTKYCWRWKSVEPFIYNKWSVNWYNSERHFGYIHVFCKTEQDILQRNS